MKNLTQCWMGVLCRQKIIAHSRSSPLFVMDIAVKLITVIA